MNGWIITAYTIAGTITLCVTAWGVFVAWAINGYSHVTRGEYEVEDEESEDI